MPHRRSRKPGGGHTAKPKLPPAPPQWTTLDQAATPNGNNIQITFVTDIPNFLTLAYTYHRPGIHERNIIRLGVSRPHHNAYDLGDVTLTPQTTNLSVTTHIFEVPALEGCHLLYFAAFDGTNPHAFYSISPIFALAYCATNTDPNYIVNFPVPVAPSALTINDALFIIGSATGSNPLFGWSGPPLIELVSITLNRRTTPGIHKVWAATGFTVPPTFTPLVGGFQTRVARCHAQPSFAGFSTKQDTQQVTLSFPPSFQTFAISSTANNDTTANRNRALLSGSASIGNDVSIDAQSGYNYPSASLGEPFTYFSATPTNAPFPGSQFNLSGHWNVGSFPWTRQSVGSWAINAAIDPNEPHHLSFTLFEDISRRWRQIKVPE